MARRARLRRSFRGPRPRRRPARRGRHFRAAQRRQAALRRQHRLCQHDPPDHQPPHPGDASYEMKIRRYVRWNAAAIVLRANKESSELGGHIASFQSAATLYDTGFMHFWRAADDNARRRPRLLPGPFLARHLRPRLSRRAAERRSARQLPPGGRRQRPVVLSASLADAGLLAVPDGVDGPRAADGDLSGAVPALSAGPRPRRHRRAKSLGVLRRRRDGRAGIARRDLAGRPREARQPDLRHQLQPAAARRAGARQRQDRPGARGRLPRRRLERHQVPVGLAAGTRCSPRTRTASCAS